MKKIILHPRKIVLKKNFIFRTQNVRGKFDTIYKAVKFSAHNLGPKFREKFHFLIKNIFSGAQNVRGKNYIPLVEPKFSAHNLGPKIKF